MNPYGVGNEDQVRQLLVGRSIVRVDDPYLILDDGTVLEVYGNDGCGGCPAGHYSIHELVDHPVNAIMAVEFDYEDNTNEDVYQVFVYAQDERIKLLEARGFDNGYYGRGWWIRVLTKS